MIVSLVTFPPGWARLATRLVPTGSDTNAITMGMVAVARLRARVPNCTVHYDHFDIALNEFGGQPRYSIVVAVRGSPLDYDVAPLHVPCLP
jgi:hypothetical protein